MPKHTKQTKSAAVALLKQGLSIPTVAAKTNLPKSTLNLWKKELAANYSTETLSLEKLVPEQKITSRYSTEIERRFIEELSTVLPRIDLTAITGANLDEVITQNRSGVSTSTDHFFIKDFNAFYDAEKNNLVDSLTKAANLVKTVASNGSSTDIHLHFIVDHLNVGSSTDIHLHFIVDHLNVGSFYIKKMEQYEQYEQYDVFVHVLKALSQVIHSVATANPNVNVGFTVHGADFRSSMMNYILNTQIVTRHKDNSFVVLSGLKSKLKEDEHIRRSSAVTNPRVFFTDLQSLELGPEQFSLGIFNLTDGIARIRTSIATKSINLNIIRW